jgi:hypothetical protein
MGGGFTPKNGGKKAGKWVNSEFAEGQDRPAAQTPNTKSCRSLYLPVATHPTIEIIV